MGWWLGICFLGLAGQMGFMYLLWWSGWQNRLGAWMFLIIGIPFFLALFVGWRVMRRFNRQRIARLAGRLEGLGFPCRQDPSETTRTEFCTSFAHLLPYLGLTNGAAGVQWFAADLPHRALLFEHEYFTGSGKSTQQHNHTVLLWPASSPDLRLPALPTLGWFMAGRLPWYRRHLYKDMKLKDASFAGALERKWYLAGDAATGRRFLTPGVQGELERAPKGEAWYVGVGWVCCCFYGTLDEANIEAFVGHARTVLRGM